jgi:uncharacterized protein YjbI with pentapeptide repeats
VLLNAIGHIRNSVQKDCRRSQPGELDGMKKAMTKKPTENCNYCANLRAANLVDCNLLGVNLEGTKLESAQWD